MAAKSKTRVSATTKKALNDLRKDRARRQGEIAQARMDRVREVDQTFAERERLADSIQQTKRHAQYSRAKLRLQTSVADAIRMGAHSRRIAATDGSPMTISVSFDGNHNGLTGWNDWNQIFVGVDKDLFNLAVAMDGYHLRDPELAELVMDAMVGVGYHEIGHSVHSPDYKRLLTLCEETWPGEASVQSWKGCLNALDDQRLETATVIWSPNLARSLTSMVEIVIAPRDEVEAGGRRDRFNLLRGRFYLPDSIRDSAREAYEERYGAERTQAVADAIDAFLVAQTYEEMAEAINAYRIATQNSETRPGGIGDTTLDDGDEFGSDGRNVDIDIDNQPASDAQIEDDGKAIRDKFATNKVSDGGGKGTPPNRAKDMAQEFQRDMQNESFGIMTAPTNLMTEAMRDKADKLGQEIARRLRTAAAGNSYRWVERQRHGKVNSFVYRTRTNRADMNFHRQERGTQARGFDLDVSVLLDVSGSMAWQMDNLSIAGHAIKRACDDLGAHCTVGLYSDTYVVLYGAEDRAGGRQLSYEGGTHPKMAFEDLTYQRSDSRREKDQLVIVLTDGQFHCSIAPYEEDHQHWLGVALDDSDTSEWAKSASLRRNNFTDIRTIGDSLELAEVLESWLYDMVVTN